MTPEQAKKQIGIYEGYLARTRSKRMTAIDERHLIDTFLPALLEAGIRDLYRRFPELLTTTVRETVVLP